MAIESHLERDREEGYYVNSETGEFLGDDPYDIPEQAETDYIKVVPGATYECPVCGYEGNRYSPLRHRPTIEAPLHKKCPNTSCSAEVSSKK